MEKSLVLVLPDRSGVLREATGILSRHGVSILRMSYNRVVDTHAFFMDVWGTSAAIREAQEELRAWRFLPGQRAVGSVYLLELGSDGNMAQLEAILAHINRLELNITFVDMGTDRNEPRPMQVGVYVEDPDSLQELLSDLREVCDVRVVPRGDRPLMLDNNHFTLSFAHTLAERFDLSLEEEEEVLINSSRIMQNLIRTGCDPFQPFTSIYRVAETTARYQGDSFAAACRITRFTTAGGLAGACIEPPVGSDTWILECDGRLFCIDAGYCCYRDELEGVLRSLYPDWDQRTKELFLTHGDIDHVGACDLFDRVYASSRIVENFEFERLGVANWREQSSLSFPYTRIGCILSRYRTPAFERMACLGEPSIGVQDELFRRIDTLDVAPLHFEVWEGKGGHVRGETVLIERTHRICVSGDVFVNVHGETKPQARFNELAPSLMTSVDSVPDLARQERAALFGMLGEGTWQILGGHGALFPWKG